MTSTNVWHWVRACHSCQLDVLLVKPKKESLLVDWLVCWIVRYLTTCWLIKSMTFATDTFNKHTIQMCLFTDDPRSRTMGDFVVKPRLRLDPLRQLFHQQHSLDQHLLVGTNQLLTTEVLCALTLWEPTTATRAVTWLHNYLHGCFLIAQLQQSSFCERESVHILLWNCSLLQWAAMQ